MVDEPIELSLQSIKSRVNLGVSGLVSNPDEILEEDVVVDLVMEEVEL